MPQVNLLPGAVSEMLVYATISGSVTKADRYGLLAAILDESLSTEEREAVDRLLRSMRRGRVKIVDEISAES